ncbi:MAG: hypothetical protein QF363_17005 [Planctomycetaceae bacterium]|nr:hypothetical protein [Planctomycetaceae bacterium]
MQVAAASFNNTIPQGSPTGSHTGAVVEESHGFQQTRILLLHEAGRDICIVSSDFPTNTVPISDRIRDTLAEILKMPRSHVVNCSSHNHCSTSLAENTFEPYQAGRFRRYRRKKVCRLTKVGRVFMKDLKSAARKLRRELIDATTWWAEGQEARISYHRKARRADGSSYFMREADRVAVGRDYHGDIETRAPVVTFRRDDGSTVAALAQFAAHPVTAYHPEKPLAHGEYPSVAVNLLSEHLASDGSGPPVAFLQGCCGDINTKKMFVGGVETAERHGRLLGKSYISATRRLQRSETEKLDLAVVTAPVPLAELPSVRTLERERAEMEDFVQRAIEGDEDTLTCVGLNFPRRLSPLYRARLVEMPLAWNHWALSQHRRGRADRVARTLDLEMQVLRIGDVGIVGMPCEPFQGIGRQIRLESPLPISIPCGYTNVSHGYITDGANTGGREYMSSFYRYTKFRPPLRNPAGDVLADEAVRILRQFAKETTHRK